MEGLLCCVWQSVVYFLFENLCFCYVWKCGFTFSVTCCISFSVWHRVSSLSVWQYSRWVYFLFGRVNSFTFSFLTFSLYRIWFYFRVWHGVGLLSVLQCMSLFYVYRLCAYVRFEKVWFKLSVWQGMELHMGLLSVLPGYVYFLFADRVYFHVLFGIV